MRSVKLDDKGRVTGIATGPPRPGWIELPGHFHDPQGLRHDGERWHRMTLEERQERENDHYPAPEEHPGRRRLRELKGKKQLTQAELHQAVVDIIDAL